MKKGMGTAADAGSTPATEAGLPTGTPRGDRRRFLKQVGATGQPYPWRRAPERHARGIVNRVKCLPSEEADRMEHEFSLCELEVVLKSGARKTARVEYHRGHFRNPMTDAEMEEKFRLMAQRHLRTDRMDNLLHLLWNAEGAPKASTLIAATRV